MKKGSFRGCRVRVRCGAEEGAHRQQKAQLAVHLLRQSELFQPLPQGGTAHLACKLCHPGEDCHQQHRSSVKLAPCNGA